MHLYECVFTLIALFLSVWSARFHSAGNQDWEQRTSQFGWQTTCPLSNGLKLNSRVTPFTVTHANTHNDKGETQFFCPEMENWAKLRWMLETTQVWGSGRTNSQVLSYQSLLIHSHNITKWNFQTWLIHCSALLKDLTCILIVFAYSLCLLWFYHWSTSLNRHDEFNNVNTPWDTWVWCQMLFHYHFNLWQISIKSILWLTNYLSDWACDHTSFSYLILLLHTKVNIHRVSFNSLPITVWRPQHRYLQMFSFKTFREMYAEQKILASLFKVVKKKTQLLLHGSHSLTSGFDKGTKKNLTFQRLDPTYPL